VERLADMILRGDVPPSMMRRAAAGEIELPAAEAVEILVHLSRSYEYGATASETLARFDLAALCAVASDPATPIEVLVHLLHHPSARPALVAALCENPSLPLSEVEACARQASPPKLEAMRQSARLRASINLGDLLTAPTSTPSEVTANEVTVSAATGSHTRHGTLSTGEDDEADDAALQYIASHAEEVAKEEGSAFELVASAPGEDDVLDKLMLKVQKGDSTAENEEESKHLSLLQRIGNLKIGERIKLAMRGNREERMVLIRDRSKLVSLAVLDSPKVNDAEMETFAAMKNVQESVLRAIAGKRQCMKNYGVMRTLVNNPKTPIDVSLPLIPHLQDKDKRSLSVNKNMSDTVRKTALRLWRLKSERKRE
jgi:hypothetical protein